MHTEFGSAPTKSFIHMTQGFKSNINIVSFYYFFSEISPCGSSFFGGMGRRGCAYGCTLRRSFTLSWTTCMQRIVGIGCFLLGLDVFTESSFCMQDSM